MAAPASRTLLPMTTADTALPDEPLETAQARLLYDRASGSAIAVSALVALFTATLAVMLPLGKALAWFAAAGFMVGVTLVQPRLFPQGISRANARQYLALHTAVSGLTGLVWGVGCIWLVELDRQMTVFTTTTMVVTIALGGISPQSAYRRSYVALATGALLPFAAYLLYAAPWPVSAGGLGLIIAYAFFMAASARVEIATREALAAKRTRELADELRVQRDAVQRANEEKSRFLAATSHDLAQPLHAQGFYIAALRQRTDDPAVLALADKIETTWRGIGQLLDGLVEISRLDAGAVVPDMRAHDAAHIAARIADEFAAQAEASGLVIERQLGPCPVRTDRTLLGRILRNLVANAVRFTPSGGTVTLVTESSGGRSIVRVCDTGAGIPAEAHTAVFKEYVQLGNEARAAQKGLGLGLSIVDRLARLLEIDFALESAPGRGTEITLDVPSAPAAAITDEAGEPDAPPRPRVSSLRVLVVDDEEAIRLSMSEVLTSWGCEAFCADPGADIAKYLDRMDITPDVIVVDFRLGGGRSGSDVIDQVREELNETVRAILMTGDLEAARAGHGLPENTVVLQKPIAPSVLLQELEAVAAAARPA